MPTRDIETGRAAPLDMSASDFRASGHDLVDRIADWLDRLPRGPVMRDESPAAVRNALGAVRRRADAPGGPAALAGSAQTSASSPSFIFADSSITRFAASPGICS